MTSTQNIFLTVLALMIIIIFAGAIYAFILAILQFIFSKGDAEKVKKAWNNIRYMIIGILFTVVLLVFFPIIFKRFSLPGANVYTAKNIFTKAGAIVQMILNGETKDSTTEYDVQEMQDSTSSDYNDLHL